MKYQIGNDWEKLTAFFDNEKVGNGYEDLSIEDKELYQLLGRIRLDCDYNHASEIKNEIKASIYDKISDEEKEQTIKNSRNILPFLLSAVASVAILLSLIPLNNLYLGKEDVVSWVVFSSPNGVSNIVLPDSSVITVNKGSTISYSTEYNQVERMVRLEGEACFNVRSNEKVPFIVSLENVSVRVLGTVFNVSAYKDDDEIVTSLLSGSVELENTRTRQVYHLIPNQSAVYNKEVAAVEILPVDVEYTVAWVNGKLLFKKNTFKEICKALERKFNCTIHVNNVKAQQKLFTGKFVNDESLPQILDIIRVVVPFDYTIKNNHIEIN